MLLNPVYNIDALAAPVGGSAFSVTIASGTVTSDLADFPVMVDLSDMPPGFWASVRADGGNIRAFLADGITPIPMDVTHIDTVLSLGRMYVRHSVAAGSDTVFKIILLDPATTGLPAGDANGQYAVWQDYDGVVVFPSAKNRVDGAALTSLGAIGGVYPWKEVLQQGYIAHQGVAFDGTYHYAVDTNYLRKYSTGLTVVASNSNPCGNVNTATGETTLNHCGAPTIVDGELWMPVEVYPAGTYNKQYVARFSLTDLSFIGYIHLTGTTRESSALIVDNTLNRIYVSDYANGASIPYFNKTTGVYIGAVTFSSFLTGIQGIAERNGKWLISCDGYNAGILEVDPDGTVGDYIFRDHYLGIIEGVSYHAASDTITYQKDGGGCRDYRIIDDLIDWRRQHGSVSYLTMPSASTWTCAVSWRPTPGLNQQGISGVNVTGDSGSGARTAVAYRSTGKVALWNSSDGWLETAVVGVVYNKFRTAIQHNGTTARKAYANGAVTLDTGCALRPASGVNMDWFFGASNSYNAEQGYGDYQFAWIRKEALSDAWMAADAANMNNPSAFYTVTADP